MHVTAAEVNFFYVVLTFLFIILHALLDCFVTPRPSPRMFMLQNSTI